MDWRNSIERRRPQSQAPAKMRESPAQLSDDQCRLKDLLRTWMVSLPPIKCWAEALPAPRKKAALRTAGQPIKLKRTLSSSAARLIKSVNIAICCLFAATQRAHCGRRAPKVM